MRTSLSRRDRLVARLVFLCLFASGTAVAATPSGLAIKRGAASWLRVDAQRAAPALRMTSDDDARTLARLALRAFPVRSAREPGALTATTVDRFADGDRIVHFEQLHLGLPVVGRGAVVRLAATGAPRVSAVDVEDDLPETTSASLTASDAARVASRFVVASASDAHLVVWPLRGGGARLAWAVLPTLPAGLPFAPRVIVDASDGDVLEARDLARTATALVFGSNPVKTPTAAVAELAIAPDGPTLTNPFVRSLNCVDNSAVKSVNLFGTPMNMRVCDVLQTARAEGGVFHYPPADEPGSPASKRDEFAEVSMYHHASKAYAFFRALAGSDQVEITRDKPLPVVANLQIAKGLMRGDFAMAGRPETPLEPFQNAFFSPSSGGLGDIFGELYGMSGGGLWFGQGPRRDYAYDGDVVYHEFTHAVVDASLRLGAWHIDARGAIDAPGAMNEAISDYFSSAITGDPDVGEYAATDIGSGGVIRTLANDDQCPSSIVGESHVDSTLFSGALWEARNAVPEAARARFDAALYKAMLTHTGRGDLGFDDVATLFSVSLGTDLPEAVGPFEAAMTRRGILPSCDRVLRHTGAPIEAFDPRVGGFLAPGRDQLGVRPLAPGIIQIESAAPAGTSRMTVTFRTRRTSRGGGAGSPFGDQGSPFTPVVLAKFDAPLTWTLERSKATVDADAKVTATKDGSTSFTASFDVPAGAARVFVQIANEGQGDGLYDSIDVQSEGAEPSPGAARTPPPPLAPAAAGDAAPESGGCASSGRSVPHGGVAAFALGALALLHRRRIREVR